MLGINLPTYKCSPIELSHLANKSAKTNEAKEHKGMNKTKPNFSCHSADRHRNRFSRNYFPSFVLPMINCAELNPLKFYA